MATLLELTNEILEKCPESVKQEYKEKLEALLAKNVEKVAVKKQTVKMTGQTSYNLWCAEYRAKNNHKKWNSTEIGAIWRELPKEEKAKYVSTRKEATLPTTKLLEKVVEEDKDNEEGSTEEENDEEEEESEECECDDDDE
jgi:hypothetical protein